ncbi:lipase family protein [Clostridium felsineum]|uniref:lipase family protein n=1 Tax=Clostridium felsineum TaxID=36839 RepID=UPI00214D7C71|nr:lipase family protein [Clostridium felsineum]MCR3761843.1 lipase family protein [Clostridium felsineum]
MRKKQKNTKQFFSLLMIMFMVFSSIDTLPVKAEKSKTSYKEKLSSVDKNSENSKTSTTNSTIQKQDKYDTTKDSDHDGLSDALEKTYGTNPNKPDTDGDGISDYIEIKLNLNPLKKDTDGNGINDGEEDTDGDGLSNLEEIKLGTDCTKKDTDGDGISDGDEVKKYHTSPLLSDTDGDGISDGDEVHLGLNPLKASSDGVTRDSDRKIRQNLSSNRIADSLKDSSNLFVPALSGALAKVIDNEVFLDEYNNEVLSKNRAVIGKPIKLETSLNKDSELKLSFSCSKFLANNDISNLNKLVIYQYKDNRFIPLSTTIDKNNKSLSTSISGKGIYFVLDNEQFLDNLGINPLEKVKGHEKTKFSSQAIKKDTAINPNDNTSNANVNDGTWVLLSDYQYVKLKGPVSETSGTDSDGDGVSDYDELGTPIEENLTPSIEELLQAYGIPKDYYSGKTSIEVYQYKSNPVLPDTDYDGKNDNVDSNPLDNSSSGTLHTAYADSKVSYTMDYRDFFESNSSYSRNIGTISSIYSSVVYSGDNYSGMDIKAYMEDNGIYDVCDYNLADMYNDSDLSEAYIGHRKVSYNGQTKEVIAVIVRGTNGTIQEWSSNFDIGTTEDYYKYSDWIVQDNHKGFDVAATRILRCLEQYENLGYTDKSVDTAYWVMGHSRGAAIANIIGARLEKESKNVYTYTFAAPNTTTASDAGSYVGIYNILNTDDLVPYLPMTAWKFTHYGKSVSTSIAKNYEKEWEDLTGCKNEFGIVDYNNDAIGMDNTIKKLSDIMENRNEAYEYSGSLNDMTIRNYGTSKESREKAIAKIPDNALPYCTITRYNGFLCAGWDFTVCQQPEYFMQVLAAFMANKIDAARFAVELNTAKRYEDAKIAIIRSGLGGIANPHYTESYYLLSTHTYASSFN